jgi:hypothetical protein
VRRTRRPTFTREESELIERRKAEAQKPPFSVWSATLFVVGAGFVGVAIGIAMKMLSE